MYIPAYLNTTYPVHIMLLVCMFSAMKFHQHDYLNKDDTIRHANTEEGAQEASTLCKQLRAAKECWEWKRNRYILIRKYLKTIKMTFKYLKNTFNATTESWDSKIYITSYLKTSLLVIRAATSPDFVSSTLWPTTFKFSGFKIGTIWVLNELPPRLFSLWYIMNSDIVWFFEGLGETKGSI